MEEYAQFSNMIDGCIGAGTTFDGESTGKSKWIIRMEVNGSRSNVR